MTAPGGTSTAKPSSSWTSRASLNSCCCEPSRSSCCKISHLLATGDDVKTAVSAICRIDSRPCSDGRFGIKPITEVEFVLMPRETETDLRCLPDEQVIDTEDVWTEDVNEWVGETRIAYTGEEFWTVTTRMMDFCASRGCLAPLFFHL